jgi:hypothetical protein
MLQSSIRCAVIRGAALLACAASLPLLHAQTANLVAYYPLNGDAQDASGNALHGTVTGAVPTADRFGNASGALNFLNDTDRVNCGNPAAFNFSGPFSLSAWVKPDGTHPNSYIVAKYDFDFNTFTASPHSYGLGTFGVDVLYAFVGGDSGYVDTIAFSSPVAPGGWHAVTVVYDGAALSLYVNGNPASSIFVGALPPFANSVPLTIGGTSLGQVFGGAIDDVRIHNGALSPSEVLAQYQADIPQAPPIEQALVAHYALNADAKDKSGHGLHGTLIGTTPIPDRFGKKDRALYFNGASDRVVCGNPAEFNFTGSFTLSAWIKMDGTQFNQYVVAKYEVPNAGSAYGLGINGHADAYGFIGTGSGYQQLIGGVPMNDNEWHAIAFVYEAGSALGLYMDGQLISSQPVGFLPPLANATPLTIGSTANGFGFVGGIDDVRIHNKALSATEIAQQFEADTPQLHIRSLKEGLVAFYPLDGNARDRSKNKLDGTLVGTAPTVDRFGAFDRALYFDGNADRVNCGNPAALNFTNNFTVAAWVKLDGPQFNNYIVAKYDFDFSIGAGVPNSYGMGLDGSIDAYGFVFGDAGYADLRSGVSLADDAWHFLTLTYDSNVLRLYRDGALVNIGGVGPLPPFANALPLTIGGTVSGQGFRGAIDSVRLYNRALTDSEVAALLLK